MRTKRTTTTTRASGGASSSLAGRGVLKSAVTLFLGAAAFDCATLEAIPAATCGNGVVDARTEDCDSFPGNCGKPTDGAKACRLTCDRLQPASCPTGWGCSVEGFCRQPTGDLAPAGAPLSAGAAALIAGDFDGDGRVDIVGAPPYRSSGSSRVHFFDADTNLATTTAVQVPISLPVIKDFNHDRSDDLGFAATGVGTGGFAALAGQRDRSFSPILFPAITIPKVTGRVATLSGSKYTTLPGFSRSCVVAVAKSEAGNKLRSFCGDSIAGEAELNLDIPAGPDELVSDPKTGIIYEPSVGTICGEVVAGYNTSAGQGTLFIASPCDIVSGNPPTVRFNSSKRPVEVAVPGKLRAGPVLADISYDGYADIFVQTDKGVYVAINTKAGLQPFVSLSTIAPYTTSSFEITELPLAALDLNGDSKVDLVFPSGVLMSRVSGAGGGAPDAGAPTTTTASGLYPRPRDGEVWSDVLVGNFNGDQLPDLLVMYRDGLDVELLGNAGEGVFTTFVVRSDQAVRAIVNGDFDGDTIQDVAFLQSPRKLEEPQGAGETIDLVLAYGRTAGGPDTPHVVGRFKNARAVTMLHDNNSGVDNLAVVESIASAQGGAQTLPTTMITVLFGSGGRQIIAPLFFRDEDAKPPYDQKGPLGRKGKIRLWEPVVMQAGALRAQDALEVFSVAVGLTINFAKQPPELLTPFPTAVWVAPNDPTAPSGLGTFAEVARITELIAGVEVTPDNVQSVIVATVGDIDSPPNGLDEVVNLARTPKGTTTLLTVRPGAPAGADNGTAATELPTVTVRGGDPIQLADVNADGAPDLIALSNIGGQRKVFVLLNNKAGGFSATPIAIEIPPAPLVEEDPIDFAPFISGVRTETNKTKLELAVITPTRLFVATLRKDDSGFDVRDQSGLLASTDVKNATTTRLTSLTSGDFNGDGVQDIAVADSGSIRILRQNPRLK